MAQGDQGFAPHWFGQFELLRLLGVGGMAEVYLARTTGAHNFSKLVVVKRILRRLRGSPRFVEMFVGEAKRAVLLQHANIVQIFSLEDQGDWPFIVMEFVHGKNLREVVKAAIEDRVGLPIDFSIHCVAEMLKGLSYAHDARGSDGQPMDLIHRDITPENIYISFQGDVKLGDFGVAHGAGELDQREMRGKMGYVAPEVFERQELDQRSDIFSAGVVLWEALAQRKLYRAKTGRELLSQLRELTIPPPSQFNSNVPPDLDRVVLTALARDRSQRFRSAEAFEEALSDYLFARRLRWTRRRIAEVMVARYPADSRPLELPPQLPVSFSPQLKTPPPVDLTEASVERMVGSLKGSGLSQVRPLQELQQGGWAPPMESRIFTRPQLDLTDSAPDDRAGPWDEPSEFDVDDALEAPTEEGLLLVSTRRSPVPVPLTIGALVDTVINAPGEVEAIGLVGSPRVPIAELGPLLYWEALHGMPPLSEHAASEDSFEQISPTRLLYEMSASRMTGTLLLERGDGKGRRVVLLRGGMPLYVFSDEPADGAPAVMLWHELVDPSKLLRALVAVMNDRRPFDTCLTETMRDQGEADAAAKVHRYMTEAIIGRLYPVLGWEHGRYRVFPELVAQTPYFMPLPPLLGYLLRGVRRSLDADTLFAAMMGRGERAVVLTPEREAHLGALNLKPGEQHLVQAIDGRRSLPQLLGLAGIEQPAQQHQALALLYTLAETRIVELV